MSVSGFERLFVAAVLSVLGIAAAVASEQVDYRAQIEAANRKVHETLALQDATAIANLYTVDGWMLPPNQDFVRGREEIAKFWEVALMLGGDRGMTTTTIEVDGAGDTANEVGRYVFKSDDGKVVDEGKFIVIWKLVDGEWKLHRDIFNSSFPPPSAEKPAPNAG